MGIAAGGRGGQWRAAWQVWLRTRKSRPKMSLKLCEQLREHEPRLHWRTVQATASLVTASLALRASLTPRPSARAAHLSPSPPTPRKFLP